MQNGKGDKPRPYNVNAYIEGYDAINWSNKMPTGYNAKADKEKKCCRSCRFLHGNYCKNIRSMFNDTVIEEINKDINFCSEWASKKVSLKK